MTFVSTTTAAAASSVRAGISSSAKREFIIGYGTSASAPFVSGIAALMLSQNPALTAAQLRSRIEQFATRPAGSSRSDSFGWGIVNAYNSLTQTTGPARQASARLVDATTGAVARTTTVNADGSFAFAKLTSGSTYYLQAGEDEAGDGLIGVPGRRFAVAGGLGNATVFNVGDGAKSVALALGLPFESEPNDDVAHANLLTVGSYVVGTITTPDVQRHLSRDDRDGGDVHVRNVGTRRIVRTRHRARHVLERDLGDGASSSARTTTSIRCRIPSARACGCSSRRGSTTSPSAEARSTSRSPRRTGAIASRFAPATSGGEARANERRPRNTRPPFQHQAFGFELRYFSSQPCTSPHHSFWFCGLSIQWPSSGKITSRLGTFMRWSDVNIDRSSVYGTR